MWKLGSSETYVVKSRKMIITLL